MGALERNVAGTRQANARAKAASRPKVEGRGAIKRRSGRRDGQVSSAELTRRRRAKGVGAGYGGMGYGPTAPDPTLKKAMGRADPSQMTRDVIESLNQPKTVRAQGSIWDDPNYSQMANEHGAEYAMKVRNLDRQINSAQRMRDIQKETLRDQNEMEALKLQGRDLEQANRAYMGTGQPPAGRDQLATDATGAYTGEGHQEAMVGRGPMTEGEQAALERQHELRKEGVGALTQALRAELGKEYASEESQRRIQGLLDQLDTVLGGGTGGDASTEGGEKQSVKYQGKTYKVGDTLPNGRKLTKIYDDGTVEVE